MRNKPLQHFLTSLILLLAFIYHPSWIQLPRWFILAGLVLCWFYAISALAGGYRQIKQPARTGWLRIYDIVTIIGGSLLVVTFLIFWIFLFLWFLRRLPRSH